MGPVGPKPRPDPTPLLTGKSEAVQDALLEPAEGLQGRAERIRQRSSEGGDLVVVLRSLLAPRDGKGPACW